MTRAVCSRMRSQMFELSGGLFGDFSRHMLCRPQLTMRVRITAAHDVALVFKKLHGVDVRPSAKVGALRRPSVDHGADAGHRQVGKRQIVARREANYPAHTRLLMRLQQWRGANFDRRWSSAGSRNIIGREQCWKVVVKNMHAGVLRIDNTIHTFVARAKITGRIVLRAALTLRIFNGAQPGPCGALR